MRISLLFFLLFNAPFLFAQDEQGYKTPPKDIIDLVLAKPTPGVSIDNKGEWMLLLERSPLPSVEELAQPELRIAGIRINPNNFGPSRGVYTTNFQLKNIKTGDVMTVKETYEGVNYLQGKKIATSYPVLVQNFLNDNQVTAEIHEISGSVEIAPGIGLADAIVDLVSSGSTLFMNGLKEVETVFKSEAVLIRNNDLNSQKQQLLDKLLFRIRAVRKARNNKYILLNAPNGNLEKIISLLPGMKSPTVLPLAEAGWSSVHSVLNENEFWEIIEKLKDAGAQGILVVPIEKMII